MGPMAPGSAPPSIPHQAISGRGDVPSIVVTLVRLLCHQAETRDQTRIGESVDRSAFVPIELERSVGEEHHDDTITTCGGLPHQTRITVDEHVNNVSEGCDRFRFRSQFEAPRPNSNLTTVT